MTTLADGYDVVAEAIRAKHPHQVPEIVAVPVSAASPSYAAWVQESVRHQ